MNGFELSIPKIFDTILEGLKFRDGRKRTEREELERTVAAITKIRSAVVETKAYLYDRQREGVCRDRELALARRWQEAAKSIWRYDRELFEISNVKALGYADPTEWERGEQRVPTVKLDDIVAQCDHLIRTAEKSLDG